MCVDVHVCGHVCIHMGCYVNACFIHVSVYMCVHVYASMCTSTKSRTIQLPELSLSKAPKQLVYLVQ